MVIKNKNNGLNDDNTCQFVGRSQTAFTVKTMFVVHCERAEWRGGRGGGREGRPKQRDFDR